MISVTLSVTALELNICQHSRWDDFMYFIHVLSVQTLLQTGLDPLTLTIQKNCHSNKVSHGRLPTKKLEVIKTVLFYFGM